MSVNSWIPVEEIESTALDQIKNLVTHPKRVGPVVVLPDVHAGMGMPIGTVIALDRAISPNMVGSDIGCGVSLTQIKMEAEELSPTQIDKIFELVTGAVPAGVGKYKDRDTVKWAEFSRYMEMLEEAGLPGWHTPQVWARAQSSLGTLGSGNHFMELQRGADGAVYLMIHTGSRGLGMAINKHYHRMAVEECQRSGLTLPDTQLAMLSTDDQPGQEYIRDMMFALAYAEKNRQVIMEAFEWAFFAALPLRLRRGTDVGDRISIHHNYAALENHLGKEVWVHRKGATSAKAHELGLIPGTMGTLSYVVKGRGNPLSMWSCSHGAGRALSRSKAKETITLRVARESMGPVRFYGSFSVDEAPGAYKDVVGVVDQQSDLIEPVLQLTPLAVYKG